MFFLSKDSLQVQHTMALVPAIQFSDLAAQLTSGEVNQFIKDFAASNSQLIIQLLSIRFINQSTVLHVDPLNAQCNEIISTIILSRDTDRNQSGVMTFNKLPHILIGHCGSFLNQKSYRALSLCNRSTYLGMSSPNMLEELTVYYPGDSEPADHPLDLSSFPMANKLTLRISNFRCSPDGRFIKIPRPRQVERVKIIASKISKMPRLQSLDIYSLCNDHELIEIMANHQRTNQNVRCIRVQYDTSSSLTAFKNLEFLHLEIGREDANATVSEMNAITRTLGGLKGLTLSGCNSPFGLQLLQAIGHQLQYLELYYIKYGSSGSTVNLENTNFENLKQLVIREDCACDLRGDILKTATNLEKARIDFYDDSVEEEISCITEMIGNCEKLEYFEIVNGDHIEQVLDAVNRGLFRSRMCERESLKIRIENSNDLDLENEEHMVMRFDQTIHQLQMSKVEQWMILLGRYTVEKMIKKLIDSLTADVQVVENKESNLVVISNPNCTINGYAEQWLVVNV